MSTDDQAFDELRREVRRLRDREEIRDCVMRHARGVDRHDVELTNACYHSDGVARYGSTVIPGPEHGQWSNEAHTGRFALHLHHITTHNCEIDGDVAYCESYVVGTFLSPDQRRASMVSGRYFDQLERRDGAWRIAVRRTVVDICLEGDASFLGAFRGSEIDVRDFWSRRDLSYQRPLDVETPAPAWH
jgi:hypothetical protein